MTDSGVAEAQDAEPTMPPTSWVTTRARCSIVSAAEFRRPKRCPHCKNTIALDATVCVHYGNAV
jgi:hypothetical protein